MFFSPSPAQREAYRDLSICILTPCGGYESPVRFLRSAVNMVAYSWMHGLKIYQMGNTERTVVDWARNDLARIARGRVNEYTGQVFTHLLWLDDDHVFNPDMALWLAQYADKDMVSALYYGRCDQILPVAYVKDTSEEFKHFPIIDVPEQLCEVDAVGFGALLMKRDVLDRVPEPWFTLDWRSGEDIAFCTAAKKHGVRIFVDGRYKIGHMGPRPIVKEGDYKKYLEDNPQILETKYRVDLSNQGGK